MKRKLVGGRAEARWRKRGLKGAFTLLELLVIISIIALLEALLLPALIQAKYSAKNTACRNNLRQISLGLSLYVSANGKFPFGESPSGTSDWFAVLELPRTWAFDVAHAPRGTSTFPYGYFGGVFLCPLNSGSFENTQIENSMAGPDNQQVLFRPEVSYGYNHVGVSWNDQPGEGMFGLGGLSNGQPTPESAVVAPSDLIALGDCFSRSQLSPYDGRMTKEFISPFALAYFGNPAWDSRLYVNPKKQPGFISHHGRANRAFVDGHLNSEDMRKPFEANDEQLRHWNVDNLPHRNLLLD